MGSTTNKSLLDVATQKIVESQVWRSIFRHGYPDTPLNQSLVMMGNVFLHLHPVKVSRKAMKLPTPGAWVASHSSCFCCSQSLVFS